jgi:hypothetical protein
MEIVLTWSELFHMENGVMAGPTPMDLVHAVILPIVSTSSKLG